MYVPQLRPCIADDAEPIRQGLEVKPTYRRSGVITNIPVGPFNVNNTVGSFRRSFRIPETNSLVHKLVRLIAFDSH